MPTITTEPTIKPGEHLNSDGSTSMITGASLLLRSNKLMMTIRIISVTKTIDIRSRIWYNTLVRKERPVGQAAKTPPSQGGNMGSIPVRVTRKESIIR